ncbi:hypothetical protein [Maribacter sp. Asnod1-A12]|uniref:hypothetical protein n=1 Tax=Maribacter sp. Asnod1-A12 TaxID=3160576 RepID=UPI0038649C98
MRSNVDFPIPLTPTIAASSPFCNSKDIDEATTSVPYPIDRFATCKILFKLVLLITKVLY